MSVTSGFFNSINGDRKYNAEQISAIFNGIIRDGILASIGTAFTVTYASGNSVEIGVGRAWFNGIWLYNDSILPLELEVSEAVLDRIDAIVIEIDHSDSVRKGDIKIIKGTPSSSPSRPTMIKTDHLNQYPLAYVYRKANSATFSQADITSMIGTSACPYVTGILQVINTDNIVAQWEGEWDVWSSQWPQWEASWNQWLAEQIKNDEQLMSEWMSEMRSFFDAWFHDLQVILDGDVAGNFASDILELQDRFRILAEEGAVYESIQDGSNGDLLDSDGNPIEGRTVLGSSVSGITPEVIGAYSKDEADARFAEKPILKSIILPRTGWSDNRQTIEVSGILQDELSQKITVASASVNKEEYDNAGVECVGQGIDSLTFSAVTATPSSDLTVLITIEEVIHK